MDVRYDAEALRLARQASAPGEGVLWAGRPGRRWVPGWEVLHPAALLAVIVGTLSWHAWQDRANLADRWWFFALMGLIPGAPLGLLLWLQGRRDREVYAVTDQRVLILHPGGMVRHAVGLERAGEFRLVGRSLWLGGEEAAVKRGKTDLDGGLARFDALPKLERLGDAERVMAIIKAAAPKAAGAT